MSFFIQDTYFVDINHFQMIAYIYIWITYLLICFIYLLSIEAWAEDQNGLNSLAPQINLNSDIKENTVHKDIPIPSKMDLIRVEIKRLIILRECILSFTLLYFSYFALSRPDYIDADLVINSEFKRIKWISELQTEWSFSKSWFI